MFLVKKINNIAKKIEKKPTIAYGVVLFMAFLMRIYKLAELSPFTMDEEYQTFLAQNMLKTGHVPLIGVNVADTGLYLAPLFTYLSALLYWLGKGNPLITAWAAVFIGILTCYLLIKTITLITKDQWLGIIGGLLYAVNPLIIMYDRKFWNPSFVMFLSTFWLFALLKTSYSRKWWWGVALIFGLAFHFHYSLFILIIPTTYLIFRELKYSKEKIPNFAKKILGTFVITITVFIMPLLIFELRHGFVQIKGFIQYLGSTPVIIESFGERLNTALSTLSKLVWMGFGTDLAVEFTGKQNPVILSILLIFIFLFLIIYLKQDQRFLKLQSIFISIFASYLLVLVLLKSKLVGYYFLPLFPLLIVLIMTASAVYIAKKGIKAEYLLGFLLALVLAFWTAQSLTFRNSLGLSGKIVLMQKIKSIVGDRPYELEAKGKYAYEAYRYLAAWQGITPVKSYMDKHFSWLYGESSSKATMKITLISQLDRNEINKLQSDKLLRIFKEGEYYIVYEK